jgi:hypothetical protein
MKDELRLFTSNPSEDGVNWYVWDMYAPLPPLPVFVGTMEDAGLVADALNQKRALTGREGD